MLKSRTITLVLLLMGTVAAISAADQRNFWLLNNTGNEIYRFYASSHNESSWGEDILGRATLPHGVGTVIYFHGDADTCYYDFRVTYRDGSTQDYTRGVNICNAHAVQFNSETNEWY